MTTAAFKKMVQAQGFRVDQSERTKQYLIIQNNKPRGARSSAQIRLMSEQDVNEMLSNLK